MVKKKSNKIRNILLLVGLFALGIFTITIFAKIWSLLIANADIVLLVSGGVVVALVLIRILSPKRVKKALFGSVGRFKA